MRVTGQKRSRVRDIAMRGRYFPQFRQARRLSDGNRSLPLLPLRGRLST
jgi:hypothetical protein